MRSERDGGASENKSLSDVSNYAACGLYEKQIAEGPLSRPRDNLIYFRILRNDLPTIDYSARLLITIRQSNFDRFVKCPKSIGHYDSSMELISSTRAGRGA